MGATSLCFSSDGARLHCGEPHGIRTFDVARPGRTSTHLRSPAPLTGITSTLAACPGDPRLLAAGCTGRTAAVYSATTGTCVAAVPPVHRGGVTQVALAPDGGLLCTGARKDSRVLVWDLRRTAAPLHTLARAARTNQRLGFSLYTPTGSSGVGLCLVSGTTDGAVVAYALATGARVAEHCAPPHVHAHDAVNGASMHPALPYLATTTGQRTQLVLPFDEDDGNGFSASAPAQPETVPPALRIFRVPTPGHVPCTS